MITLVREVVSDVDIQTTVSRALIASFQTSVEDSVTLSTVPLLQIVACPALWKTGPTLMVSVCLAHR